jgi:hypothetical protein
MERSLRLRTAERIAALLVGAISLVPLGDAVMAALLVTSPRSCDELCSVFVILALVSWFLGLAGLGLAVAIWTGTRLGPFVGLVASTLVLGFALNTIRELGRSGFTVADDEVIRPLAIVVACLLATVLLAVSILIWAKRLYDRRFGVA